jgi:gliding motility-associated-like protein
MSKNVLSLLVFCGFFLIRGQVPDAGSGFALDLTGFNNAVGINGNWSTNGYPISITAWIYADPTPGITQMPIVFTKDDPNGNRGFQLSLNRYNGAWFLEFGAGDGTSLTDMALQSRIAPFSKINVWTHVAVVATAPQQFTFYIDGIAVPSVLQSNNGAGLVTTGPGNPRIGGSARAGQPFFRGGIDEVTIFNSVRTQQQIRDHVCRKTPISESGLVAYYKMDEASGLFLDATAFGNNGAAAGPARQTSGAYIGDQSVHMYGANLNTQTLTLITSEGDTVTVENYTGSSGAIQLYAVNSLPNHKNGLPQSNCVLDRYFGIYTTETFDPNTIMINAYLVRYRNANYFGQDNYLRFGNDDPLWAGLVTTHLANGFNFVTNYSREFILAKNLYWQSNLPDTIQTCTFPITLASDTMAGLPLLWNTGATTSEITIQQGGYYWVRAQDSCNVRTDSVFVMDLSQLDSLIQGNSLASQLAGTGCNYPISLQAPTIPGVTHRWPDGSTGPTFAAGPGTPIYLMRFSPCDTATTDTFWLPQPNPWQSGLPPTLEVCNFPTQLQVAPHPYGHIVWSTGDTGVSATISTEGWVFVEVVDSCERHRDSVLVTRFIAQTVNPTSLAAQWAQAGCDFPHTFTFSVPPDVLIFWHDGSTNPTFTVQANGWIKVVLANRCDTLWQDSILLDLVPPQTFETRIEKEVCRGFPVVLEPDFTLSEYFWSTGARSRTVETDAPGELYVYGLQQCDTLRTLFTLIRPPDCPEVFSSVFIPNAFTPNDDGKNDVFLVRASRISEYKIQILNRWGQVVYASERLDLGWDGTTNGQPAQEGVYSYVVYYRDFDGYFLTKTGTLTLMR